MKRYISLLLILPLVLAAVAAPVSAAEANYGVYNLLDYGPIVDVYVEELDTSEMGFVMYAGNKIYLPVFNGSGYFSVAWTNPGVLSISGWSALVIMEGFEYFDDEASLLTISDTLYGPNVKFLSCTYPDGYWVYGDTFDLGFYYTSDQSVRNSEIEFLNFYIKSDYDSTIRVPLEVYDVLHGTSETAPDAGTSYDYSVNMNDTSTNSAGLSAGSCCIRLRPVATEGTYDYYDLNFEVTGINITSISCLQGDKALDFDVGYSYLDADGTLIVNSDSSSGKLISDTYTRYWVSLRIYTEGANFIQGWPVVFINGTSSFAVADGQSWTIRFYPTYVSYNVSILDPYVLWLNKIYYSLNPSGANAAVDVFQSQVDQQSQQLQEMAGVMDSVDKPALDSVSSDMSGFVSQGDIALATAPFNTLMSNEIILTLFSMALIFVTAAYVLYGKRG